jgi:hypothetical protein
MTLREILMAILWCNWMAIAAFGILLLYIGFDVNIVNN